MGHYYLKSLSEKLDTEIQFDLNQNIWVYNIS